MDENLCFLPLSRSQQSPHLTSSCLFQDESISGVLPFEINFNTFLTSSAITLGDELYIYVTFLLLKKILIETLLDI